MPFAPEPAFKHGQPALTDRVAGYEISRAVTLDLTAKVVTVVGGGPIAVRKVRSRVTVGGGGRVWGTGLQIGGGPMPGSGGGGGEGGARGGPGGGAGGPQRQLTGEKASGTVKFFNAMKGFGFIQRDDGQPDAFVHISAVERAGMVSLNEGDRLEFELEVDRRGKYAAVNLTPVQS